MDPRTTPKRGRRGFHIHAYDRDGQELAYFNASSRWRALLYLLGVH